MTDQTIQKHEHHKLLTQGKSKSPNPLSISNFARSCLLVIFCFGHLAICGSVQAQVYPDDLAQYQAYDVVPPHRGLGLDWADHQVVPLAKQPFGSGVLGQAEDHHQSSTELWTFGTSKENEFPCRGYLYKNKDGKMVRCHRSRDERVANVFETSEKLDVLLRQISHLNSVDSCSNFEPRRLIQLGRQLAKVSRPEAFWSLVEFNRIVPSAWKGHNGVPLIIKYLYPSNVTNFYNYRDNEIGLEGESDKKLVKHYPNFPIVTLKGIPFFLSYGYELGGQVKRRMTVLEDVEIPEMKTYTIESKLTVSDILDEIESDAHQLLFRSPYRKEVALSQLNSLVNNKPNKSSLTKKARGTKWLAGAINPQYKVDDFEGVRSWEWNDDSCMFEKPKVQ